MKKQIALSVKAHLIRRTFYLLLLFSVGAIPLASSQRQPRGQRTLTFAERVAYQRAIEDVYWRHRIWPKENADPKPQLDAVMSQAQLEKKVTDYLHKSQALGEYWQRPITAEQLQAEMDRMGQHTRQPEVLQELFEALGNDPFVIAECLARPALAERLITNWYAYDQRIHGELKQRAEAELQTHSSIKAMRETNGKYSETEFVRSDGARNESNRNAEHSVKLNSREWDAAVQKLAETFSNSRSNQLNAQPCSHGALSPCTQAQTAQNASAQRGGHSNSPQTKNADLQAYETIPVGKLSPLQEDETRYYATAILNKSADHLKLATVSWLKEPLESWLARVELQAPVLMAAPSIIYKLPPILQGDGCVEDTWTATAGPPDARAVHTAVWTGSEMIVWGGLGPDYLNTGGRYNPSTDSWVATTTTNATARGFHTAVWTGNEMIVWGGGNNDNGLLNSGGRYNPITDSWIPTTITNAPDARYGHTAVWTGSQMIVWGGWDGGFTYFNTGGRYDANTDSWSATSTTNVPEARTYHTAVWTGSEMIVWGGYGNALWNTGGRYNPVMNNWVATTTTNAAEARSGHIAVWTGGEMLVWGGATVSGNLNTGGIYNPNLNGWAATNTANAPTGRVGHTVVWTGTEMIVWGGNNENSFELNTGGRYNRGTNSWTATTTVNAPAARTNPTAVWTGSEMIVWGGNHENFLSVNTGGKYNLATDSWTATSTTNAPDARYGHTAVWTASKMIVWGGSGNFDPLNTGGTYDPGTDSWTAISLTNAPEPRASHTAVWTDSEMIVWGGYDGRNVFGDGARYNPSTNSWTATSTTNAPEARSRHTAIWTGTEMIVWGVTADSTGGRYDPATDLWTPTSTANAPGVRSGHTAVWTGSEMIVWGGEPALVSGGRYCAQGGPTPTPSPTPTPTPCTGRCGPTPRPRPTPHPRPTPP
jgi:N-acetylneuraminic acid mutarotase